MSALALELVERGGDPEPLLAAVSPSEKRSGLRRLRELLGLDAPHGPAPNVLDVLADDLAGLDADERLAEVERLAVAGDPRVDGAVLARARADADVARLRAQAATREAAKGEAEKRRQRLAAALEQAAADVLSVVDDSDPDLAEAERRYRAAVRELRGALAAAAAWQERVRRPIRRLQDLAAHASSDHVAFGAPAIRSEYLDEALARAAAVRIYGASDPTAITTALRAALIGGDIGGSSLWARIPLDEPTH